jgi:hypothetical protein
MRSNPFVGPFSALSKRQAGRAANPRVSAISGLSPILAGIRAAGDPALAESLSDSGGTFVSRFAGAHVPMLWSALMGEFERIVDYWIDGDDTQVFPISILWIEGVEGEELSPGRYSHAHIKHDDLPRPPALGDVVAAGGIEYAVVRVDALPYGVSRVVLQANSEAS